MPCWKRIDKVSQARVSPANGAHCIVGSIERPIGKNKFQPSGILNFEPGDTVYSRVESLAAPD
jgi:hypothetical protein